MAHDRTGAAAAGWVGLQWPRWSFSGIPAGARSRRCPILGHRLPGRSGRGDLLQLQEPLVVARALERLELGIDGVAVDRLERAREAGEHEGVFVAVLVHRPADAARVGATGPEGDPAPVRILLLLAPAHRVNQAYTHDTGSVAAGHPVLHADRWRQLGQGHLDPFLRRGLSLGPGAELFQREVFLM